MQAMPAPSSACRVARPSPSGRASATTTRKRFPRCRPGHTASALNLCAQCLAWIRQVLQGGRCRQGQRLAGYEAWRATRPSPCPLPPSANSTQSRLLPREVRHSVSKQHWQHPSRAGMRAQVYPGLLTVTDLAKARADIFCAPKRRHHLRQTHLSAPSP